MRIMRQRFLWSDALPDANPPPLSRLGTGWGAPEGNFDKKVALRFKGKVYGACVRSSMIYGSETWAVNAEQEAKLES